MSTVKVDTYKSENPIKASTENVSDIKTSGKNLFDVADDPIIPKTKGINPLFRDNDSIIKKDLGKTEHSKMAAENRQAIREEAAENSIIPAEGFNFEFVSDAYLDQDNIELQAQRQTWGSKARRGLARFMGEAGVSVAEIPVALGSLVYGGLTASMTNATNNALMNTLGEWKEGIKDMNPVYKSKYTADNNAVENLASIDWWATEGASGAAFFAAALVPGGALSKMTKGMAFMTKIAKRSKNADDIIAWLDRTAVRTKMADKTALLSKTTGDASARALNLTAATATNTAYESLIEAKGAADEYDARAKALLASGEIDEVKYNELMKNKGDVAGKVFWRNVGLLLAPNAIINKQLLGYNTSAAAKTLEKIGVDDAGKIGLRSDIKKATAKPWKDETFFGKVKQVAGSKPVKGTAKGAYQYGAASFREGVVEEAGQSAITNYWVDGYLNEQMYGARKKGIVQTYADVLGSTEGQTAILFSGILGSGAMAASKISERKAAKRSVESTITDMHNGLNLFLASRMDLSLKVNGETKYRPDGTPEPDLVKQQALGDAFLQYEATKEAGKHFRAHGRIDEARIIEATAQTQAFMPFIGRGQEGFDVLREALEANPFIKEHVETLNKENGTSLTAESWVEEQIDRAKEVEKDLFDRRRDYNAPVYNAEYKELGAKEPGEKAQADILKEEFNTLDEVAYVNTKTSLREIEQSVKRKKEAFENANEKDQVAIQKEIDKLVKLGEDVKKNLDKLQDRTNYKARWKAYYGNATKAAKINSGEIAGYLDGFIAKIQEASTVEEIDKLIEESRKEGLFLSKVKSEKLPAIVQALATTGNLLDTYKAARIYDEHKPFNSDPSEYYTLASDTWKRVTELSKETEATAKKEAEEAVKSIENLQKELDDLTKEYSKTTPILTLKFPAPATLAASENAVTNKAAVDALKAELKELNALKKCLGL